MSEHDEQQWRDLVKLFSSRPDAAYRIASVLSDVQRELDDYEGAVFSDVIFTLYPYTRYYKAGYFLYLLSARGALPPEYDPLTICQSIYPQWEKIISDEEIARERRRMLEGSRTPSLLMTNDVARLVHQALTKDTRRNKKS
jgi:hypothetical protein